MRKNFGTKPWLYPMPVLIVCAYDKDGRPNCMNAAWGGMAEENLITICLDNSHKTTKTERYHKKDIFLDGKFVQINKKNFLVKFAPI